MQTNKIYKLVIAALITCLLSACIGTSQSLTEEEKENLALLKAVNGETPIKKNTDKSIKVSLLDAHQVEEKPHMTFKLVLNKAASQDISVSINLDTSFTHIDAQAKQNTDFSLPNLSNVTIPAGQTETQFKVDVIDDNLIEATEQFKLIVSNLNVTDGSVKLLKDSATGTILDNEVWRNNLNLPAQTLVKLDADGNELASQATAWSCVKDKSTGLVWEVKAADIPMVIRYNGKKNEIWPKYGYRHNLKYLHDRAHSYSSFNLRYLDGEYEGKNLSDYGVRWKDLTQEQLYGKDNIYSGGIDIPVYNNGSGLQSSGSNLCANKQWVCTTHQYTLDVNQGNGLCGFRDWRVPSVTEARTITKDGVGQNTQFFPNNMNFWTKTLVGNYFNGIYSSRNMYAYNRRTKSFSSFPHFVYSKTDYDWITTRLVRGN